MKKLSLQALHKWAIGKVATRITAHMSEHRERLLCRLAKKHPKGYKWA